MRSPHQGRRRSPTTPLKASTAPWHGPISHCSQGKADTTWTGIMARAVEQAELSVDPKVCQWAIRQFPNAGTDRPIDHRRALGTAPSPCPLR